MKNIFLSKNLLPILTLLLIIPTIYLVTKDSNKEMKQCGFSLREVEGLTAQLDDLDITQRSIETIVIDEENGKISSDDVKNHNKSSLEIISELKRRIETKSQNCGS